jgi:hypothetical protein
MYRVKFIDLVNRSQDTFDYDNLFDAIKVAKETQIGSLGFTKPAIPDLVFNERLLELLTSGFLMVGPKTEDYVQGSVMIMLTKADLDTRVETSVFNTTDKATYVGSFIPSQPSEYKPKAIDS